MTIPSMLPRPLDTTPPVVSPPPPGEHSGLWEKEEFSFDDVLDMVNPLQHLPVISAVYRENSGDDLGNAARLVGGVLFGGLLGSAVLGLASATVNMFIKEESGQDVGEHLLAMLENPQEGNPALQLVATDLPVLSPPTAMDGSDLPTTPGQPPQIAHQATEQYRRVASLDSWRDVNQLAGVSTQQSIV